MGSYSDTACKHQAHHLKHYGFQSFLSTKQKGQTNWGKENKFRLQRTKIS